MTRKHPILEPLSEYEPADQPIDTKAFAARAYGLAIDEVTWQHRDPITYWLRSTYPRDDPSDRGTWYLTPAMQIAAHRYLLVVSSGHYGDSSAVDDASSVNARRPRAGEPWSVVEIDIAVDLYFEMLGRQQRHEPFVKAEFRSRCEELLPARSAKSIEYKWCNISAVLEERGEEWVSGYKPLSNYQDALVPIVALKLL